MGKGLVVNNQAFPFPRGPLPQPAKVYVQLNGQFADPQLSTATHPLLDKSPHFPKEGIWKTGYPGGLGASRFITYARGYGVAISEEESSELKALWLRTFPEMPLHLKPEPMNDSRFGDHYKVVTLTGRPTDNHGVPMKLVTAVNAPWGQDSQWKSPEGEPGVFIENTASIGKRAYLRDHARVFEYAQVKEKGCICGHGSIHGHSCLTGQAILGDFAGMFGNAVMGGFARASGMALIYGDAVVEGCAHLNGQVQVSGNSRVHGTTVLSGPAHIRGEGDLSDPCDYLTYGPTEELEWVTLHRDRTLGIRVCYNNFTGTLDEFMLFAEYSVLWEVCRKTVPAIYKVLEKQMTPLSFITED